MQSNLKVKNFGPIKSVDLDLRNVNVFIGPQASGKSALAKVYTIFKAPRKFSRNFIIKSVDVIRNFEFDKPFKDILEEYNIASFIRNDSEIEFDSILHSITYKNGTIEYEPKLLNEISNLENLSLDFETNREQIKEKIKGLTNDFFLFEMEVSYRLREENEKFLFIHDLRKFNELNKEDFELILTVIKEIEHNLSTNTALYIPAERNFINVIKNASFNLINNDVPIPKHILSFGAEIEKSLAKEIDLGFLQSGLMYRNINGEDRIFTDSGNSIKLSEAASGIQSVLPILIPILFRKNYTEHRSFVIEEPELNLFPLAQYELIKNLESSRREAYWEDYGTIHTYTTHSPYILSSLNNLLYANKVISSISLKSDDEKKEFKNKILDIVKAEINPFYFTAYQISNGTAVPIIDRSVGLISDNYIDRASDILGDDFDSLMGLLNEYKSKVS